MRKSSIPITLFFSAMVAIGCEAPSDLDPASEGMAGGTAKQVSLHSNVHVVPKSTWVDVKPDELYFHWFAGSEINSVKAGDIVVSEGGEEGFLRRVVSVERKFGNIIMKTEQASIEDAVISGDAEDDSGLQLPKLSLTFKNTQVFKAGGLQLVINAGTITFSPTLDLDLTLAEGKVEDFRAVVKGDLDASMGIEVNATKTVSQGFEQTLWTSPPVVLTQMIGTVPLVEVISIALVASGEVHAGVTGKLQLGSASAHADVSAGAHYSDGRWEPVLNHNESFQFKGPSAGAKINAGAELRLDARAQIKFYGVIGPYVELGPYARADVSVDQSANVDWNARAGLAGHFGGDISVLGHTLAGYEVQLFDVGKDFHN